MRPIPKPLLKEMLDDPWYLRCCYPLCSGPAELHHVFTYAGRQINEKWAIIPLCYQHHRGGDLDQDYCKYTSLLRATEDDLKKYPRINWKQLRIKLNSIFEKQEDNINFRYTIYGHGFSLISRMYTSIIKCRTDIARDLMTAPDLGSSISGYKKGLLEPYDIHA